jgi:hypothetical protein
MARSGFDEKLFNFRIIFSDVAISLNDMAEVRRPAVHQREMFGIDHQ